MAMTRTMLSQMEYCLTAEMIPRVIPITTETRVLTIVSLKVVGNLAMISSITGCFVV